MMTDESKSDGPMEPMDPYTYDVMITDISETDIPKVNELLSVDHLSPALNMNPTFPANGVIYGVHRRVFVPLVLKLKSTSKNVHFLYDTGSKCSYLRKETFEAFGCENIPSTATVTIHGVKTEVYLSHGRFENVNIIGQDYFDDAKLSVAVNYVKKSVIFSES